VEKKGGYTAVRAEKARDISKQRKYIDMPRTEAEPYLKKW